MKQVEEFVASNTKFKGQKFSSTALEIISSAAYIFNCNFNSNEQGKIKRFVAAGPGFLLVQNNLAGGAIIATDCVVHISQSRFESNGAEYGGTIYAEISWIIIVNSNFTKNSAGIGGGGVLFSLESQILIAKSKFDSNTAENDGGVLHCLGSTITIKSSNFDSNTVASGGGGVLYSKAVSQSAIEVSVTSDGNRTQYRRKRGTDGSPSYSVNDIIIVTSEFKSNNAESGGVLYSEHCSITIIESNFFNNFASNKGGVVYSDSSTITVNSDIEEITFSDSMKNREVNKTTHEQFSAIMNGRG